MREINLTEYQPCEVRLSEDERSALAQAKKDLGLAIEHNGGDSYTLRPTSTVGAVEVGGLSVLIRPKIEIKQLISLACYRDWRDLVQSSDFDFPEEWALPDVIAAMFAAAAEKAFARGLLHGYVEREDALQTVRGRIRFDEQIRRRFGLPLPVEVRYDEFTDDVPENRLVKAANRRLRRAGLRDTARSRETRRRLGRIDALLDGVSLCDYPPNAVPKVKFDRLNQHYKRVVELARLILRQDRFEAMRGKFRASGFLMDMNKVFQDFVTAALRDKLRLSPGEFGERRVGSLDEGGEITLKPDLVWRDGGRWVFVGDAKYKRIDHAQVPNADLYQMLAYVTALDLPGGLLIYAKGERDEASYTVRHAGKRLNVAALDLSGDLEDVLERVGEIAGKVRALKDKAAAAPSFPLSRE